MSGSAAQFQMSSPSCGRHCDNETGKGQSRDTQGNGRSEMQGIHLTKGVRQSLLRQEEHTDRPNRDEPLNASAPVQLSDEDC